MPLLVQLNPSFGALGAWCWSLARYYLWFPAETPPPSVKIEHTYFPAFCFPDSESKEIILTDQDFSLFYASLVEAVELIVTVVI